MSLFEKENTTISFRASQGVHDRLVEIGNASKTTKHQAAMVLITAFLETHGQDEIIARLIAIEQALESVKGALGRGIGAVLLNVTDHSDADIKKWVFEIMLRSAEGRDGGGE